MLPELIAVHDAISGNVIWRHDHKVDFGQCMPIFITRDITGYFYTSATDQATQMATKIATIFRTSDGKLVSDQQIKIVRLSYLVPLGRREIKGPLICYTEGLAIHVVKIVADSVKRYKFQFPEDRLVNSNIDSIGTPPAFTHVLLKGFVGKSNVLMGNLSDNSVLMHNHGNNSGSNFPELFTLDLDAAMSARSEAEIAAAFALPLLNERHLSSSNERHWLYQPMYRTDRSRGCVDVVGAVKMVTYTDRDCATFRTYNFVTKMQYSSCI